ncbi:hypothetical protein [Caulobacter sp.]|uniref:hypothetical protein n=1 Tax=Caulobacter sp. TaxID=78 RepID=UPI0031D4049D
MSLSRLLAGLFAALAIFGWIGCFSNAAQADKAETQVSQLQREAETAKTIAEFQALAGAAALEQAKARAADNHKQAVTYLQLPTPAPEDRCRAAQELVDEAIAKERQ